MVADFCKLVIGLAVVATWLVTLDALAANLSVLRVWKKLTLAGDIVQIIAVSELPPRLFCKILVSFESLYGICWREFSANLLMTWESVKRDLFI